MKRILSFIFVFFILLNCITFSSYKKEESELDRVNREIEDLQDAYDRAKRQSDEFSRMRNEYEEAANAVRNAN